MTISVHSTALDLTRDLQSEVEALTEGGGGRMWADVDGFAGGRWVRAGGNVGFSDLCGWDLGLGKRGGGGGRVGFASEFPAGAWSRR